MAFYKAKFEGKCHWDACGRGGKIEIGQGITWNPKVKPVQYFHEECMVALKDARAGKKALVPTKGPAETVEAEAFEMVVPGREVGGVKVGDRCMLLCNDSEVYGTVYSVEAGTNGLLDGFTVKRDDGKRGAGDVIKDYPYDGTNGWRVVWLAGSGEWDYKTKIQKAPKTKKEESSMPTAGDGAVLPKANGHGLEKMAELLAPYMRSTLDDKHIEKALESLNKVVEGARKELAEAAGAIPKRIEVVRADGEVKKIEGVHENFEMLLKLVNVRDHVYLWGPPGSGKSTAAHQVSDALGLKFGYISLNPQTPDSRILGYMDAGGKYRTTVFREMYEKGGVMCIDEMDNAAPSLCVTINSGLESDKMAFPDGMVERHKDFVLVATGNTTGRGANPSFPERRPFDAAFAERFTYLEWDYDTKMEKSVTLSINPKAGSWLEWVWKVRGHAKKSHPRLIVSPRASFKGAKLIGQFKFDEIAEMVVFKGLDRDTIKSIMGACPSPKGA